jgi:hypothetical protein
MAGETRDGGGGVGRVVAESRLVGEVIWKGENGHHSLYLSETEADASPASSNIALSKFHVTRDAILIHFVIPNMVQWQSLFVSSFSVISSCPILTFSFSDGVDLTRPSLTLRGVELIVSDDLSWLSLARRPEEQRAYWVRAFNSPSGNWLLAMIRESPE